MKKYNLNERSEIARQYLLENVNVPFSRTKLKKLIKKCGVTQTDISIAWGLGAYKQYTLRYFSKDDKFKNISIEKLDKIAEELGIGTWELFYWEKSNEN